MQSLSYNAKHRRVSALPVFLITTEQAVMPDNIILPPNSKAIPLTQGKFAIVDKDDYGFLMHWKWCFNAQGYASRSQHVTGTRKPQIILMHRLILQTPEGIATDHANQNKLDNRRCNLRFCNNSKNAMNRDGRKNKTSKYKGVCWHKENKRWRVTINANKHQIYVGNYLLEIDAALAWNEAAKKYHGEFAVLNEVPNE